MPHEKSKLQERIESGKPLVIAEISPPRSAGAAGLQALAKSFAGRVHALGVSDNRDGIRMSALAAATLCIAEGVEPILHMSTRDRNRVALVSDCLGAYALGIRNILCTSGTHQSLLPFNTAKNVYDIDATLLLQSCRDLEETAAIVGEDHIPGISPLCLGAVASPYADPLELQLPRLAQKISAGAQFMITHPLFDLDRFGRWWNEVTSRGLHTRAAFVAGIRVLTTASAAKAFAEKRPLPMIPDAILARLASKSDKACRAEGIAVARETIEKLSTVAGLRGFGIVCEEEPQAAIEVLEGLRSRIG
jgi:methylenetetrahydrofolate reductase (NADPH)